MNGVETLKASDILNGAEADFYADIEGSRHRVMSAKSLEAKLTKNKKEIRVLGYSGTKNKSTGWKGTGTMRLYYISPVFRRLAQQYAQTGKDLYIDLFVYNQDPSSEAGAQKVWLKNVNLDETVIAKFDIDNTELDEEMAFTFEGFEYMSEFNEVSGEYL